MSSHQTIFGKIEAYLAYRRGLGYDLRFAERLLLQFAKFVVQTGWRGPLTADLILRWVNLPKAASPRYKASRLSAARGFAKYLATRDGRTEVPDKRLMPRTFRSRPHIFGERELGQLLRAALRLKPTYRLRPLTYQTLFGLLASTGLRISEALRLTLGQIDLERGMLRIENTKFKKSRLVPLHPTATKALRRYATGRSRLWGQEENKPFFVGPRGLAISYWGAFDAFHTICRDLGWQQSNGDWHRPRIHDLRHSFACRCLARWYRRGEDVHHRIAALSTYLGHACVTDTYWYLTATPELLAFAASRFERFAAPQKARCT